MFVNKASAPHGGNAVQERDDRQVPAAEMERLKRDGLPPLPKSAKLGLRVPPKKPAHRLLDLFGE